MTKNRWLVLVGGGACGRWQGGALEALYRAGLLNDLSGIVGTSVGGLNACVLAAGLAQAQGIDLLKSTWAAIQKDEDIYRPSVVGVAASPWWNVLSILGLARSFVWGPGALDRSALETLCAKVFGELTTNDIKGKTGLVLMTRAYNYEEGLVHTLQGRLQDMALATSAIEGAFPSWQGYGDGGAGDNAPIDAALALGAEQILVVYTGPDRPAPLRGPIFLGKVGAQTHTTGLANIEDVAAHITMANEDLVDQEAQAAIARGVSVIGCYPLTDTGNFLDFRERGLWERGVAEAQTAIQAAKGAGW